MNMTIVPGPCRGRIAAIASKSQAHRLLLCAALSDGPTNIVCKTHSADIRATARCLRAMGAAIEQQAWGYSVTPIDRRNLPHGCVLECGESGSTLRFLLPVVGALGLSCEFHMAGRLPQRPLAPLDQLLTSHAMELSRPEEGILRCSGQLTPGRYALPGGISSQFCSGLLFALPLLSEQSTIELTGAVASAPYINLTLDALREFGVTPSPSGSSFTAPPQAYRTPGRACVEGDWSNAAFWLCAGAMPKGDIAVSGLRLDSSQGDKKVADILAQMGAKVGLRGADVTVSESRRMAVEIDAAGIPDLIPILSCVAAVSRGTTTVVRAGRLRLKESDRLQAISVTLGALGANIEQTQDGLLICGVKKLTGGTVDAFGDHRIAMMAAIASCCCQTPVTITGAQAVDKSYPTFWEDLQSLGKTILREETL